MISRDRVSLYDGSYLEMSFLLKAWIASLMYCRLVMFLQSEDGDVIACVDIYRQPAFDHPALKNHTIQVNLQAPFHKPFPYIFVPKFAIVISESAKKGHEFFQENPCSLHMVLFLLLFLSSPQNPQESVDCCLSFTKYADATQLYSFNRDSKRRAREFSASCVSTLEKKEVAVRRELFLSAESEGESY